MKEWKKPCMEVVVLDESDIVCTSLTNTEPKVGMDDGKYEDQSNSGIWGGMK